MSSAAAYGARGRRKVSENASQWGAEGLPVAPVLGDREKLPANLKLAAEAWPEGEDDEEGDEEGDEENEGGEASTTALLLYPTCKERVGGLIQFCLCGMFDMMYDST